MGNGQWDIGDGKWAIGYRQWAIGYGRWDIGNTAIGNRERSGEGNFLSFIVSLKNFELQISVYFFN